MNLRRTAVKFLYPSINVRLALLILSAVLPLQALGNSKTNKIYVGGEEDLWTLVELRFGS